MAENSYNCICGHTQAKHVNSAEVCYGCLGPFFVDQQENPLHKRTARICINFKLDNLSYLEQKYNQKILEQIGLK